MTAQAKVTGSRQRDPVYLLGRRVAKPAKGRTLLAGLLLGGCLTGACAMPTQKSLAVDGPPLTFRIEAVSVHLTRQPGSAAFPIRRVNLSGTSSASLERDGQTLPFRYAPKDLLILLNEFYKIRFFDLPTNTTARYSVFLKEDGSVVTSTLRMADAASTRVCFAVATYEKCVTYAGETPRELDDIVRRVFSDADRLVKANQPGAN